MKALLLAAGVGSRISRSINVPKSTLEVEGDSSIIARTVRLLTARGIEVGVVTGFMPGEIRRNLEGLEVTYFHNPFYRATNSLGSMWFARDFLSGDDVIVMNADVYWDEMILDRLLESEWDLTMIADESRVDNGDYFFNVEGGIITAYGKELAREERTTEYVGFALIRGSVIDQFRSRLEAMVAQEKYNLWWENVLYEFKDEAPVHVIDVSDLFWAEVDYMDDYIRIQNYIDGKGWK